MHKGLLIKEANEHKWKLVLGFLYLSLMAVILPFSFEYLKNILPSIEQSIPAPLQKDMNLYMSTFETYLWSQWTGKNLSQIIIAIALILGSSTMASEASKGTISFLLTKPITKLSIFLTKAFLANSYLFILVFLPTTIMYIASIFSTKGEVGILVFLSVIPAFLAGVVAYFIGLYFSITSDDAIKAFAYGAGLVIVNSLFSLFEITEKFSLSYLYKGSEDFLRGNFPYLNTVILLVTAIFLCVLCYKRFIKKQY